MRTAPASPASPRAKRIGGKGRETERKRRESKIQRSQKARVIITYVHTREMRTWARNARPDGIISLLRI